ncbi:hypothetical protein E4P41_07900 [Geodermatophilus sp. DF01-2]|uniref:hypothetical protein n=1 Tax=Geodermatophilus sp. DF01-2 TaxID=2559610 RepID=UPI0010738D2B|nr:hypothetical protein [Geodermatophilus sp. DF01_2]TFV62277.1 hypothetical protein E4P41_07900 [Geodermatophilus sp. DF01_2]
MTESNMTGRPYGGTNQRPDDDVLPGERPEPGEVDADPAEEPRAAQGGTMSQEQRDPGIPGSATGPSSSGPPDSGRPGD